LLRVRNRWGLQKSVVNVFFCKIPNLRLDSKISSLLPQVTIGYALSGSYFGNP
jgi:hypothetical protein